MIVADELGIRREMLEVLERCVRGSAPIFAFREFESAYTFEDGIEQDLQDQLDGLVLLAEEADWGLRGPEDFLEEARRIVAASQQAAVAAGG